MSIRYLIKFSAAQEAQNARDRARYHEPQPITYGGIKLAITDTYPTIEAADRVISHYREQYDVIEFDDTKQFICRNTETLHPLENAVQNPKTGEVHNICKGYFEAMGGYFCEACGTPVLVARHNISAFQQQKHLCRSCMLKTYVQCSDCGEWLDKNDGVQLSEYSGYFCTACADKRRWRIHDYSYKPEYKFLQLIETRPLFMGVEMEIEPADDTHLDRMKLGAELQKNWNDIYCKSDGSLENGVEIVSHPATLLYHEKKLRWGDIIRKIKAGGFNASHPGSHCGLHIHTTREYYGIDPKNPEKEYSRRLADLNIAKVIIIVNSLWDSFIVPFSRRDYNDVAQWAKKNKVKPTTWDYDNDCEREISTDDPLNENDIIELNNCDRYQAVNITNSATVEFRFFKGTIDRKILHASLEFCQVLIDYARTHSLTECQNASWSEIFYSNKNMTNLIKYIDTLIENHQIVKF